MLKKYSLVLLLSMVTVLVFGQKPVWEIGKGDNSASEFTLAPSDYSKFLAKDFGWEDRFFALGFSKTEKDFPYVLPGAVDYWGGTSGLSGIRPHELNLLFSLKGQLAAGNWQLVIDILDCSPENPPLLKVTVNGHSWKYRLDKGSSNEDALKGSGTRYKEQKLEIPLAPELLKNGGNEIQLTSLEGSWLVFDQIQLKGPENVELVTPNKLFLRNTEAADYEIDVAGKRFQPFLVDVQYLEGLPNLSVTLDGKKIFRKNVANGSPIFEVPMDAVTENRLSEFEVLVDNEPVKKGQVLRAPQKPVSLSDYIDTKIGTGHSRWMIAPGPWMPFGMVKISPDNQDSGWQAGYQPTFENVGAFSHIHEWTMAGLGTLPTNGLLKTKVGKPENPDGGYRSRVNKVTEKAPLGYYSVVLSDYDIKTELTATTRCSFQRYTYPKNVPHSRILNPPENTCRIRLSHRKGLYRKSGLE